MKIIFYIAIAIGLMGIVVISWGAIMAFYQLLLLEYKRFRGENICKKREYLRHHLGSYLLLGLEFLIAADIVHTVIRPTLQQLAILGSIVAIRTVISYFLNREMADGHDCEEK
ncbi:MAG: DUF1622 domain-containing protein [Candidatus Omnitrophota bacterium]